MSSRELEDRQERERTTAVARALGMPVDELEDQEWSIDENVGHDGAVYGYVVTLAGGRVEHLPIWALDSGNPD